MEFTPHERTVIKLVYVIIYLVVGLLIKTLAEAKKAGKDKKQTILDLISSFLWPIFFPIQMLVIFYFNYKKEKSK